MNFFAENADCSIHSVGLVLDDTVDETICSGCNTKDLVVRWIMFRIHDGIAVSDTWQQSNYCEKCFEFIVSELKDRRCKKKMC